MIFNIIKVTLFINLLISISICQCIGDINGNNSYDISDTLTLRDYIINNQSSYELLLITDINTDYNIDIFDIIILIEMIINEKMCFTGITETDENGNLIGDVDQGDWCHFTFDNNESISGFGLNPPYPNPVSIENWGPFGDSYQICYQYSTPYDINWNTLNSVSIYMISTENDTIYSHSDNFSNGQTGLCIHIEDSVIIESIYRLKLISEDYECFGDIEFNF